VSTSGGHADEFKAHYTPHEVAEILSVAVKLVYTLINNGDIRAIDVASRKGTMPTWRISEAALKAYLRCTRGYHYIIPAQVTIFPRKSPVPLLEIHLNGTPVTLEGSRLIVVDSRGCPWMSPEVRWGGVERG
jgi:excisionase family DNA binding protein